MDVSPSEISLEELRGYVEQAFGLQAEEKGLRLSVTADPRLPRTFYTDAQRLQQILRNLLSNAVKFTESGSVTLSIASAGASGMIAFTVTDTGVGIASDKLSLIFEAFQQADGTTSRRYGGTGLGLSISRQLARLLGGSIAVSSTVGTGSMFTLFLPDLAEADSQHVMSGMSGASPIGSTSSDGSGAMAARSNPIVARVGDSESAARQLRGATVLVVDDDVRNVFALTSALEMHGMTVVYADNGADGVRLLGEHAHIDIVLMDAMYAGDGRQRDHPRDPPEPAFRRAADRVPHRQGDARRPRVEPGRRRERLHHQTGGPGRPVDVDGKLGQRCRGSLLMSEPGAEHTLPNVLVVDDRSENLLALEAILQGMPLRTVGVESGRRR